MVKFRRLAKCLQIFEIVGLVLIFSAPARAMSVAYQDSIGLMSWNQPMMTQWVINYSVTSWLAPAAEYYGLRGGIGDREFYFPQIGFLVKRWNDLESQANVYANVGYGVERRNGNTSGALNTELQVDWESRKYYLDAELQAVRLVKSDPYNFTRLRAGFAPYLADFEHIQSWLILQVERNSSLSAQTTVTPLIRLFYQNLLIETGASLKGEFNFNFMIHI
jgi:hypothetical protein